MLYTLNISPNSAVEFLQKGGEKRETEGVGVGFLENIKEAMAKENQLQVTGKGQTSQADFLKPEKAAYQEGFKKEEEEEGDELLNRIKKMMASIS